MRKTTLKYASGLLMAVLVPVAVLLALLRSTYLGYPVGEGDERRRPMDGYELFRKRNCIQCHHPDSRETKIGPGLKGLFAREKLPASGKRTTEENVRTQLKTPYRRMPSFADRLTEEERTRLIEYLKTL